MNAKIIGIAAVLLIAGASGVKAQTHALWPGDWNNWSDPSLWANVGNPGNAADTTGYGSVPYDYEIGKFEITAQQYTAFLNAVAKTDTFGLYSTSMWTSSYGCKIEQSGSSGSYIYSVDPNWASRPANYVSWGDAARFCNWITNGQPTGVQNANTTEDGSYALNGAITDAVIMAVTRRANAKYVIPSEDEWYKAAYYNPNRPDGAGYWDYPTASDGFPRNDLLNPDGGNNANYLWGSPSGMTIGGPYYRTEVGDFEKSESPYGTFDQGGNVWEWNEATFSSSYRSMRGGSWSDNETNLLAANRTGSPPHSENGYTGFRVSEVPEPATLSLLFGGALSMLRRRK